MQKLSKEVIEFLQLLKDEIDDKFEIDDKKVGTPEYWKRAGIIELIRQYNEKYKLELE